MQCSLLAHLVGSGRNLRTAALHRCAHLLDGVRKPGEHRLSDQEMADVELGDLGQRRNHLGAGIVEAVAGMHLEPEACRKLRPGADALPFGLGGAPAFAQGFAGLGSDAAGFAQVLPGKPLTFPADFGAHPAFRIEWWYITANLTDSSGAAFGAQWTLFRQALAPPPEHDGWASQQIWMGHAAVTSATTHRFAETFARGGVGQASFTAW